MQFRGEWAEKPWLAKMQLVPLFALEKNIVFLPRMKNVNKPK